MNTRTQFCLNVWFQAADTAERLPKAFAALPPPTPAPAPGAFTGVATVGVPAIAITDNATPQTRTLWLHL